MNNREFNFNKNETLKKLSDAKKEDKVDKDIIPLLDLININDNYYTSSSCFGRIVIIELPKIGDKKNARFLGKWHREITTEDFEKALTNSKKGEIWFLAQSPILHVISKDLDSGDKLIKKAVQCGFKNSGFRSVKKNIVIEIASTERIDMPIGLDKNLYFKKQYIPILVRYANEVMKKSIFKITKFEDSLR